MDHLEPARTLKRKTSKSAFKFWQTAGLDMTFLSLVLIILGVGLIMLFSASYPFALAHYNNSYLFISKQFVFAIIGIGIMYFVSRIDYHFLRKFAWILYFVSIGFLIIVLILPPMSEGFDYKRWIELGPIQFQPSEIAKFSIVLLFAHLIAANQQQMKKFTFGVIFFLGLLVAVCGLVVFEPHLSATLLIFSIGICMMIVGGIKLWYLLVGLGGGVAIAAIAIATKIVDYGGGRIKYWLDPWADATGDGYQTIQSLLSIGSGGLFGRGIGGSRQKYLWVPEPHNDFIFSIIAEELGLLGSMIIILLFCMLVWRGFVIAMRAPDKFGALLAVGLTFQVGVQAALNIMVVTNTIPNTGISLPFFSYGGTSLLMLLAQMGVVLSISRQSKLEKT